MAECNPNAQKDEDGRWKECRETFESTENTSQLDLNASDQKNKPEVTTRDKNIWNAPDQSEGRNDCIMAECPSPQEDEEDVWEDCMETFESTENIPQLNLKASNQENRKPELATQGEISQTWKETDQTKRSNGKNSLDDGSQPESHEIGSTESGDHNANVHVPAELKQERNDAVQPEITPYKLPKEEPNTVHFYLLILGKSSTNHAKIRWVQGKKEQIVPLHLIPKENSLWYCAVTFPREPIKFTSKYTYCLGEFMNAIPGKDQSEMVPIECKEKKKRTVKHKFQFDVFIFPDSRHCHSETAQSAVIWYIQWLLKFVDDSSISPILTNIQGLNLTSVKENHMKKLVYWILEQALQIYTTTDIQRFYLCIILSHLPNSSPFLRGNKKACDCLLQCSIRVYFKFLSTPDLGRLKKMAIILVENSSSPGRLTLAAYFYPCLGIEFLLEKKQEESLRHQYNSEEYQNLVTSLFSCLKVDDRDEHRKLLKYVMGSAPTLVDVLDLFQRSEISKMFANEEEKVDFFVEFFKTAKAMSEMKKGLREKFDESLNMPEKIRNTIQELLNSNEKSDQAQQNKREDGVNTDKSTEKTSQLHDPLTGGQENNNQEVSTQGEHGRTRDDSDQSKSSNGKNSQGDGSQTDSHEIHSGKAETDIGDYNQNSHVPAELQTGQNKTLDPEIIDSQAATENRKNTANTVTESEDGSTPQPQKSSLYVKNVRKPKDILPRTPTEPKTVCFYLLIPEKMSVDCAYIHFGSHEIYPLYRVPKTKNLWYCSVTFTCNPTQGNLEYSYSLSTRAHDANVETMKRRPLKHQIQFDVFCSQNEKSSKDKNISLATTWYAKWFLRFVDYSSISPILTFIQGLNFTSVKENHMKELISWILQQALQNSTTDIQQFCLCIILSYLPISSQYLNAKKTACDRLLGCFSTCVYSKFLSESNLERLKTIALILVQNSSTPGWLTLAAHFYPYLGIKFLLKNKNAEFLSHQYDSEKYKKLVTALFSYLKVDNQDHHKELLKYVMKSAPTFVDAVELFQRSETSEIFATEDEKVDYFVKFVKEENIKRKKKKSLWERLILFYHTPEKIRSKIYKLLYKTLLEYAKSDDELKDTDIKVLVELILFIKHLNIDQFIDVLKTFSTLKSLSRQDLLLQILDNEDIKKAWLAIPLEEIKDICESWVINRVTTVKTKTELTNLDMVMSVNQSIEAITKFCSPNSSLAQKVSVHVLNGIYIRNILKPEVVKKSSQILREFSTTSLGQEIPLCILEIIAPEIVKDGQTDEDNFMKILDWFDIWIILLDTNGAIEDSQKYKDGKEICKRLKEKIEKGDIILDFLKVLDNEKEKVSMLCASALGEQTLAQSFEKEITDMMYVVEDCYKKIQSLESTINYGKELWIKVYSHPLSEDDSVIETFYNLKKTLRARKVNELQDHDNFWGKLLPLLNQAEVLNPWVHSISFMAVAKTGLQESRKSSLDEDENKLTVVSDFNSFINFLATETFGTVHARWTAVLNDPYSCSLATIKTLLGNFEDPNKLDQELKLLEENFKRNCSPDVKSCLDDFTKYPNVLKQINQVTKIFNIFQLKDPLKETMSVLSQCQTTLENSCQSNLAKLQEIMKKAYDLMGSFSGENLDCAIKDLPGSSALLGFIEKIVDEDIRFLIDAVEEHSNQFVSESLVSNFIDVHSFLAPLIKKKNEKIFNSQAFLKQLEESCHRHKDIAEKIKNCNANVNSLRGLYKSIANRGELTKEIIGNCLSKGEYRVSQKDGKSEAKMSYVLQESGKNNIRNYCLSDLHDLRSRALLIVSSQSIHSNEKSKDIDFEDFITQVNLLTEIWTLLTKLCSSGYLKYQNFEQKRKTTHGLKTTRDKLKKDLENWENELKTAREKFYFLNYYYSDQICTLYNFLINGSQVITDEVLSLVHFVDRTITKQQLEAHQKSLKMLEKSGSNVTQTVGEALEKIFEESQPAPKSMLNVGQSQSHIKLEDRVIEGEIFVATLEPESPLTANVLLALYESTSKAFPEPYQIVFCSCQTTWEEIHLLLQRCFTHSERRYHERLFCIVNVELLTNELQFKLVNEIKEKQKCHQNRDYQLALICRGGDHHHVVEQLAHNSHHISGMSDLALSRCLKSGWPDVKMITSSLPGLGKTKHIKDEVLKKSGNKLATFSISGPFKPCKLIKRLKELKLQIYHCLHLDIGEVSDPWLLDTFLFQLIVTGMVSAENQFYHLPTTHIYMEIANTLKDTLRESLVVSKYFTRVHLEWQNYKNLLVSNDITSDVQVVCQYLDVFDRGCIKSKEVDFSESNKSKPLPTGRCQELLAKYFSSSADVTFTTLHTFLAILADQLKKFSKSAFFKIDNLRYMMGYKASGVRYNLFHALLTVTKELASRAITTRRSSNTRNLSQQESSIALDEAIESTVRSAKDMVERVDGMIQWEDSNHLLVVFHGINSQSITAIYRNRDLVPYSVKKLLESQEMKGNKELNDFNKFTQKQLQEELEKIACMKVVKKSNLFESYALTPDNILKMVLIILRVRVNVPVIIMGETGCGKTSLVRYLANTCGVELCTFSFHAGISEKEIIAFIKEKERDIKEQMWIFLDEINTCDHLGLINDIMCHHSMLGRPISKYLVFLAACNPYRLRPEEHIKTAGLKDKDIADEYSKLVYRVHPLPEAMVDFVWDYGSLAPKDERDYIQRMVRGLPKKYEGTLVNVLVASQQFIRDVEKNPFCVSLRDVHRCIRLISWFQSMTKTRQKLKTENECPSHLREYQNMTKRYNETPIVKSIVLALAHCYLSRLPTAALRKDYRKRMVDLFNHHEKEMTFNENLDSFSAIVRVEEEDYLDRMKLPLGTARNAALRENVFVMLVCILNTIPIFVVGKPGCSKSLSIQLILSNLRGRDSRDPLFRELPQLYVVSYQGSESSTSEGIKKVFDKARKYKSNDKKVLPVVLLDEVGLAENSKNNPLKVLHSLLEPGDGKLPDVAVVGISNWSLDAAKMNRAIHLSRPEPTVEDLYETGHSVHYAKDKDKDQYLAKKELKCLAEAYFEYQNEQTHANFHGLRDYYALIKSLKGCSNLKEVNISLQRNFGGLPGEVTNIQKIFLDKLKKLMASSSLDDQVLKIIPVTELIQANLKDLHARHLMLITIENSAVGILQQILAKLEKETITIYGSRFEEDLSEEYNYRILSRIILYMERDCILILKDLESIYGSLYDMLNQNYTVVGNKKNCRVALGPYSNPMCQVHDGFRCIVLIDQHKVDYSDPPFLNRFEKQVLRFSDVLTEDQQHVVMKLRCWVQEMSTVEGFEIHFKESDLFIGFHEDTLPSLVLLHCRDSDSTPEEVLKKCKDELMWIASPDGVLRTQKCKLFQENSQQVQELSDEYFRKPLHQGFTVFIQHVMTNHQKPFFASDEIGSKTVVMTFSSIHTDIRQCLQLANGLEYQVERLSSYKSEKLLSERINEFWETAKRKLLVLQCKPDLDGSHLMLARCIVEEKRNTYKKCVPEKDRQGFKHVCIVVHVQRGAAGHSVPWQFNFLSDWKQVFLDVLEAPPVPLNNILGQSAQQLLSLSIWPIHRITRNDLLWCFTCIKYTRTERPVDFVLRIAKNLFNSQAVSKVMDKLILQSIEQNALEQAQETNSKENWQVEVACDRQSLVNSSTLYSALEQFVSRSVRNELAKIVFFLEKENAWPPHLADDSNRTTMLKLENLWCEFIMDSAIFKIADIPKPLGANTYLLNRTSFDLCLPFIQVVFRKIDSLKELFLEDYESLVKNDNNLDDKSELKQTVRQQQLERFSKMIVNKFPELLCLPADCCNSYMEDLFRTVTSTAEFSHTFSRHQRACIVQAAFVSDVKQILPAKNMPEFCTLLHIFVWVRREHILNLLRMVDYCLPFIGLNVSARLTNDTLCSLKKDMLLKITETNLYQGLSTPDYSENRTEGSYDGSREGEESTITASESTQEAVTEPKANETTQEETKLSNVVAELKNVSSVSSEIKDKTISEMHDKDSIRFGDILVTTYCEEMFPSQAIVQKNGGIKSWTRNANSMLSLASRISECPTALHYLRFCVDFSRIMLSTTALQERFVELLYNLNNIGTTLQPKYLDHEKSIAKITSEIIKPLEKGVKDTENFKALQKFTARFYCRCIDTNVDTSGARLILEQVFSLKRPELVMMMSPVVSQLLAVEECQSRGIFKNLINDPSLIKKCPCLQNINEVFKDHFLNGLTNYDSYPAVMICDLIQRLSILQINFKVDDTDRFDSKILELAKSAKQLVQDKKHSFCLRVLSAVAFLRGFFTVVAQGIGEKPSVLKKDSPPAWMTDVNSLLKDAKPPVQMFFIKQLHEHASLFDLQKWFSGNTTLPAIEQMWHDEKSQNKVVFTSVFKYPEYEKAKVAYLDLTAKKYSTIEDFLTKCQKSPDHTFTLLGMLINIVYLKRAVRKLSDKEELFVNYFEEKVALFPPLCQDLLLRVIGRREFYCPQLQLSPESSVEEVEMALLILHIACVVATGAADEKLPLYRYFTNPSKFERPCVLAHCKEDMHSVFEYRPSVKESVCVTCTCGSRLAFQSNIDKQLCPHCHVKVNNKAKRSPSSETSTTQSISSTSNSSLKWDLRTKQTNPAIYHALHLIVYACYYGGIALGTSSAEKLRSVENILRGLDLENDSQSLESFCFQNIESDLSCLMKILRCKKDVAIKTMHVVVEKSSDLMRSKNLLGTNNCSTPKMRREWEATFSKKTETVFLDAQETSKEIKNMMKLKQTEDSQINTNTLECRILELDNYPVEPEEQNKELKRLFRTTKQPSFEDFRSAFLYSPQDVQVKHSFLTLFFARFDQLSMIHHLHHLLKWSRIVSSSLTLRISRKDAEKKSMNDFIKGHLPEVNRSNEESKRLQKLFDDFKEAWDKMRDPVNQKHGGKEKMPRLMEIDCLAYSLTEGDFGKYLKRAIEILVPYQNSILDAIISLSSLHQHPVLSFLENGNCSGVPSVTIQNVKEKEIINFQWSDDLFQDHAQNNPEYGKGHEVMYDFEQIEMELVNKIVFGKFYLTGTLDKFIFAKELFHSCGSLLTEIRLLVKQSPDLPKEVLEGVIKLKENRIEHALVLLQHIEVLIYLLKRKLKDISADMTLKELADKWSTMLPSPFPVTELLPNASSIKIEHVAALYEALEDVLADGAIKGLDDKFRNEMSGDMKKLVSDMVDKDIIQLKSQHFLNVLRRFAFRYLSSETEKCRLDENKRCWLDENKPLQSYLQEPSLWAPLPLPNLEEIPQDITLKYIDSMINYLKELGQEKKGGTNARIQGEAVRTEDGRRRYKKRR